MPSVCWREYGSAGSLARSLIMVKNTKAGRRGEAVSGYNSTSAVNDEVMLHKNSIMSPQEYLFFYLHVSDTIGNANTLRSVYRCTVMHDDKIK